MNIWNINMIVFIADVILFYLNIARAEHQMKTRYPELNFKETPFLTGLATAFKIYLVSICPILNLGLLYVLIFKDDELIESAVQEAYRKHLKDQGDNPSEET